MGQDFIPNFKKRKGAEPQPPPAPVEVAPPARRRVTVQDLIGFRPSLPTLSSQPSRNRADDEITRRRVRLLTWILGGLALLCLVLGLGPESYRQFKLWRASGLARQGEALIQDKKYGEAIPIIHSAFIVSPDAPEVLRAMAQILTALNLPNAMTYWNWTLATSQATDDDRRAAVDCAMQNGLYNQAQVIIQDLIAREGQDARNQLLAARWCSARGTPVQTMYYATHAVSDDPTYKPAAIFLAVQELANPYLHQEAVDALFQLAQSDDVTGLQALRQLAHDARLRPGETDRLIARLLSHPLAGEAERDLVLELEIKRHPGRRNALIDQAEAAQGSAAPADLAAFAEWLDTHGEAARVLKFIPREKALSDKDVFSSYLDALAELKRWDDLKSLLSGASVPLDAPLVELYLARCAGELGDSQGSDLHWQRAVAAASYNPIQSLHLALYAEKLGQNERAAEVYRSLTQNPVTAHAGYLGLTRVLADKDARTLRDILEQAVTNWPTDDDMISEYVYYNLLINERAQEMHRRALALLADDSRNIAARTDLAFACLRLNDPTGALDAYSHAVIDWNNVAPPNLVVYAATLYANGHVTAARRALANVNRHNLRPELRDLIKSIP